MFPDREIKYISQLGELSRRHSSTPDEGGERERLSAKKTEE